MKPTTYLKDDLVLSLTFLGPENILISRFYSTPYQPTALFQHHSHLAIIKFSFVSVRAVQAVREAAVKRD